MEASSKTYVGGAPEKSSEDSVVTGAQLIAEEFKKQVRKKSSSFIEISCLCSNVFRVLNTCLV